MKLFYNINIILFCTYTPTYYPILTPLSCCFCFFLLSRYDSTLLKPTDVLLVYFCRMFCIVYLMKLFGIRLYSCMQVKYIVTLRSNVIAAMLLQTHLAETLHCETELRHGVRSACLTVSLLCASQYTRTLTICCISI